MTDEPEMMEGEHCPFCNHNTMTLRQAQREIPYFGMAFVFSMDCSTCKYHKADVELESEGKPVKYSLDVTCEDDLKIRIVKSSNGLVKIPHVGSIEPGEVANGYVSNVEGVINRIKHQVEVYKENSDDAAEIKKCKNILKKINKALWGQESLKLIIEDPTGNSAIISDKAVKTVGKK